MGHPVLKWNTWVISSDPPFIKWHVRCTIETFISIVSDSEARNARVTFVEKAQNKNNQFSKWKTWIFNAILDQTLKGTVVNQNIFYFFLYLLVWVSAMQCNAICRMYDCLRKGNASNVLLKEPPPWDPWRHAKGGGLGPPRTEHPMVISAVFRNLLFINIFKYILADDNLLKNSFTFGTPRKIIA